MIATFAVIAFFIAAAIVEEKNIICRSMYDCFCISLFRCFSYSRYTTFIIQFIMILHSTRQVLFFCVR